MATQATGTFKYKQWDEKPYSEVEGGSKLARACVINAFQGDVDGEGTLEYLMSYTNAGEGWGSGTFTGFEQVVGRVQERSGSFVLQHSGTFEGDTVSATWSVVPGSGAGELRGLRGTGGFVARHGEPAASFTLDYDFEA
jgi:hypothetical protein